ncbi:unnamed protein product [Eruca vesicaria subsp. sativa]|uniref:Uncharacterized protein n=1 Tax=Eruca vesicaria subsp. sativa TaxID=29727 RepID=A0ABC8IWQ5_ERUVS|nr:unnamed protein product [Eruca vesicaria subsp. sativa]
MNALVRMRAIMSNGPFMLNLDCDHYIYNYIALREDMCFMLDRGGGRICYVQFPLRFEGIDPNHRYANHNTVFSDVSMRALDGLQGPMYVGTGCIFLNGLPNGGMREECNQKLKLLFLGISFVNHLYLHLSHELLQSHLLIFLLVNIFSNH